MPGAAAAGTAPGVGYNAGGTGTNVAGVGAGHHGVGHNPQHGYADQPQVGLNQAAGGTGYGNNVSFKPASVSCPPI